MLKSKGVTAKRRPEAAAFTDEETAPEKKIVYFIDEDTIWNRFRSSSTDLLSFILSRQLTQNGTWEENIDLFCRIVDAVSSSVNAAASGLRFAVTPLDFSISVIFSAGSLFPKHHQTIR